MIGDEVIHTMDCTAREASGREKWECRICDRVLLVTWPWAPEVLIPGDTTARHGGSKGPAVLHVDQP